jgi:hypothetical protein
LNLLGIEAIEKMWLIIANLKYAFPRV